jgi:hypothetical protein
MSFSFNAWAQYDQAGGIFYRGNFLAVDLTMNDVSYEEPGVMTEDGLIGGVRAELGYGLGESLSISVGGSYYDGSLLYEGATFGGAAVKTRTTDYFRTLKAQLNYITAPFVFSIGYAERTWYDDLVISYRRLTEYEYIPLFITWFSGPYYYQLEHNAEFSGLNTSYMSDLGRNDVFLKQKKGSGIGLEVGRMINASPIAARAYLQYHKWDVEASEIGNDGVQNLVEPANNTVTITAGVGILF